MTTVNKDGTDGLDALGQTFISVRASRNIGVLQLILTKKNPLLLCVTLVGGKYAF